MPASDLEWSSLGSGTIFHVFGTKRKATEQDAMETHHCMPQVCMVSDVSLTLECNMKVNYLVMYTHDKVNSTPPLSYICRNVCIMYILI